MFTIITNYHTPNVAFLGARVELGWLVRVRTVVAAVAMIWLLRFENVSWIFDGLRVMDIAGRSGRTNFCLSAKRGL